MKEKIANASGREKELIEDLFFAMQYCERLGYPGYQSNKGKNDVPGKERLRKFEQEHEAQIQRYGQKRLDSDGNLV